MGLIEAQTELQQYYAELKTERAPWEGMWRDTARYTLPSSQFDAGINGGKPSSTLTESIYDGTSISAAGRLAAELLGMTLNPNDRNFEFTPMDPRKAHDPKNKAFNQYLGDSMQYLLHAPDFGFYTAAHEMLIEYVRFGQGQFLVEKRDNKPYYLSCPLSQCYTELNDIRKVDSFVRSWRWTLRQLRSKYPPEQYFWPGDLQGHLNNPAMAHVKIEVCHAVLKSVDHPRLAELTVFPKPYTHLIFLPDYKCHVLETKGLDVFPMPTPRYMMMSEETYGRGPGTLALPDTRMVNTMEKTNVRAVQKMADPPLLLPRRGWLRPIDISPSALNYYDGLEEMKIQSFGIDGNPQLSAEFVNQHRAQIREMYHVDDLQGPDKKAEMKEVEVLDDQESRMRVMAPQLARLYTEWISPTLSLNLYYFNDELINGYDGELPDDMQRSGRLDLRIRYMSPLQRAQSMLDASNVKRVMDQFFLPVMQIDPQMSTRFDPDGYVDWLSDSFNLPTKLILSKDQANAKRQQMQGQQDQAQGAATAVDQSQALLNAAKAQQAMPQAPPGQGVV